MPAWLPFWVIREPSGIIDRRLPSVEVLRSDAENMRKILHPVITGDKFMSIYRMDMNEECPLWARSNLCESGSSCTIEQCIDDEVPAHCRFDHVVKVAEDVYDPWLEVEAAQPTIFNTGIDNFLDTFKKDTENDEQYFDLAVNLPGNTNYRGQSLWGYIYKNNCLHSEDFSEQDEALYCTEEGAYYKMISGMQTVIAVLNAEHSDDTAMVPFNASYFKNSVAWNESWISNLYFTFGLLQRSACILAPLLENVHCPAADGQPTTRSCDSIVEFLNDQSKICKSLEDLPPFVFDSLVINAIQQLRDMSTIMNCVECEKCRLHAKVKVRALETVVKATSPKGVTSLERNELVAFLHALDYFSEGILIIERFKWRQRWVVGFWVSFGLMLTFGITKWILRFVYRKRIKGRTD